MTKFCSSCHTENRDGARFCRGCTRRFSGIKTPARAFDSTRRDARLFEASLETRRIPAPAILPQGASEQRWRWLSVLAGVDVSVVWLLLALTVLQGSFVLWYLTRSTPSGYLVSPTSTKDERAADSALPAAAPLRELTAAPSAPPQKSAVSELPSASVPPAPTTGPSAARDSPSNDSGNEDARTISSVAPSSPERPAPDERSSPITPARTVAGSVPTEVQAQNQISPHERSGPLREEKVQRPRPLTPPVLRSSTPPVQAPMLSDGCNARGSAVCGAPSPSAPDAPDAVSVDTAPSSTGTVAAPSNNPLYKVFDALRTLGTAIALSGNGAPSNGASGNDGGGTGAAGVGADAAVGNAAGSTGGSPGGGGSGAGGAGGGAGGGGSGGGGSGGGGSGGGGSGGGGSGGGGSGGGGSGSGGSGGGGAGGGSGGGGAGGGGAGGGGSGGGGSGGGGAGGGGSGGGGSGGGGSGGGGAGGGGAGGGGSGGGGSGGGGAGGSGGSGGGGSGGGAGGGGGGGGR